MDLLNLQPFEIINTSSLEAAFKEKYHLTLPTYYAYQIVGMMHQENPNEIYENYLNQVCIKQKENKDFRHGVIDAFCEVVKAGVKRIAFSHATDDLELFALDLFFGHACAKKYGISYYIEEELIETSLFKNSGRHVIIFYANVEDLYEYLKLKADISENKNPTLTQYIEYGERLGALLSYNKKRIDAMIASNMNRYNSL